MVHWFVSGQLGFLTFVVVVVVVVVVLFFRFVDCVFPLGGGGVLGSIFAGYVSLSFPNPYPI